MALGCEQETCDEDSLAWWPLITTYRPVSLLVEVADLREV
jgi:hypothetical protein